MIETYSQWLKAYTDMLISFGFLFLILGLLLLGFALYLFFCYFKDGLRQIELQKELQRQRGLLIGRFDAKEKIIYETVASNDGEALEKFLWREFEVLLRLAEFKVRDIAYGDGDVPLTPNRYEILREVFVKTVTNLLSEDFKEKLERVISNQRLKTYLSLYFDAKIGKELIEELGFSPQEFSAAS